MVTLKELGSLKGRLALITGAAGGLGTIFSETLAELGASLILVDLPGTQLEAVATKNVEKWHIDIEAIYCDLESSTERASLIRKVSSSNKNLNVLVNNAAFVGSTDLAGWNVPFGKQSVDTWRRAHEVNLTAVFDLCQGLYPAMKDAAGASIINVTSIYGSFGPDWSLYSDSKMANPAAYAASKGGLNQLTRWLATTLAPTIRVNAISPGGISRNQPRLFQDKYESKTPMGRMATEQDFKGALAFLASDLSSYVTGHILEVDGGWGVW